MVIAIVLATRDAETVYWTASAAMGLACLTLLPLRGGSPGRTPRLRVGVVHETLGGLRYVRRTSPYPALLVVSMSLVAAGMLAPLLPVFARDVTNGDGSTFAILATAHAMGLVTGSISLLLVASTISKSRLLLLSLVAAGASIALVAATTSPIGACALLILSGVGLSIGGSLVSTFFPDAEPRRVSRRLQALSWSAPDPGRSQPREREVPLQCGTTHSYTLKCAKISEVGHALPGVR